MKFALLGFGGWGQNHARVAAGIGTLTAVCDPDSRQRETAKRRHGVLVTDDPLAAIDTADAVIIASPPQTHFNLTLAALSAGKHVLVEKPVVETLDEALVLTRLAEIMNLCLMGGHLPLYYDGFDQFVESAREASQIVCVRHSVKPGPSETDVLWGLGPHDAAILWKIWGSPSELYANVRGNGDRLLVSSNWNRGQRAVVSLDWKSPVKQRFVLAYAGDYVFRFSDTALDPEPLVLELQAFEKSCESDVAKSQLRQEIEGVTRILELLDGRRPKRGGCQCASSY